MSGLEVRGWSLHQPWSSLVARGLKLFETRGKPYPYRGIVAIHASKPWDIGQRAALQGLRIKFPDLMHDVWPRVTSDEDVPRGFFVAVARVESCDLMTPELIEAQTPLERACGDWRPGRYAYRLGSVRRLLTPEAAAGKQGMWKLDLSKLPAVAQAVSFLAGTS